MELKTTIDGTSAIIAPAGNLTVASAPSLETAFADLPADIQDLTLDLKDLDYVASAGLRVIVAQVKSMRSNGASMVISNANDEVMEVFDVTGLIDILDIV